MNEVSCSDEPTENYYQTLQLFKGFDPLLTHSSVLLHIYWTSHSHKRSYKKEIKFLFNCNSYT